MRQQLKARGLFFIHNMWLPLYSGILDWFTSEFYCGFNYKTISTYERFIERLNKLTEQHQPNERKQYKPILPSINLDPLGDLSIEPRDARIWNFGGNASDFGFIISESDTVLQTDRYKMVIMSTLYTGTMEINIVVDTLSKMLDIRTMLLPFFMGGHNRPIRPNMIYSEIIIPDSLAEFLYTNEYEGDSVDPVHTEISNILGTDYLANKLIYSINKNKYVLPYVLDPQIKLTGAQFGGEKYGGSELAKWVVTAGFNYEVHLPTFAVLQTDTKLDFVNMNMSFGDNSIANHDNDIYEMFVKEGMKKEIYTPEELHTYEVLENISIDPETGEEVQDNTITGSRYKFYKKVRYDLNGTEVIPQILNFMNGEPNANYSFKVISLTGQWVYKDEYDYDDTSKEFTLKTLKSLEAGDFIMIFVYKEVV